MTIQSKITLSLCTLALFSGSAVAQQPDAARPALPPLTLAAARNLYPDKALKSGLHGRVLVEFNISRRGKPDELQVTDAEPPQLFDDAALQLVKQVSFTVPKDWKDSGGVTQRYRLSVLFKLSPCLPESCLAPKMHAAADDFLIVVGERPAAD